MEITVQMLGTGSAFAKAYFNNNALFRFDGYTLLVDCGITAPLSLHELNVLPTMLDGILITHIHADHVGGLEEVAFVSKFKYNRKPRLFLPPSLRVPLWENTLRGGMESAADGWNSIEDFFDVVDIPENKPFELKPGFTMELVPTKHVPGKPSFGLLLNRYIYYSSDTQFDRNLLLQLVYDRKVQYVMHDCQLSSPGSIHTTLEELLTLPDDIQKRVLLMHYQDNKNDFIGKTGRMSFIDQHRIYPLPNILQR